MIVVTGVARSGTSMMMATLKAGGLPILHDEDRLPSTAHNPLGFFELSTRDLAQVIQARVSESVAVKALAAFLVDIPLGPGHRVIRMRRPHEESARSFTEMHNFPRTPGQVGDLLSRLDAALAASGLPIVEVGFHDLIDHPTRECHRLADELADVAVLDVAAMIAVPDRGLRHYGYSRLTDTRTTPASKS